MRRLPLKIIYRNNFLTFRRCLSILILLTSACQLEAPEKVTAVKDEKAIEEGKRLLSAYACIACHHVPGVSNEPNYIGPPLTRYQERAFIAGRLANHPENLIRWLMNPNEVDPETAMPDLGLSREEAARISAYLYSH